MRCIICIVNSPLWLVFFFAKGGGVLFGFIDCNYHFFFYIIWNNISVSTFSSWMVKHIDWLLCLLLYYIIISIIAYLTLHQYEKTHNLQLFFSASLKTGFTYKILWLNSTWFLPVIQLIKLRPWGFEVHIELYIWIKINFKL